jgi:hypothetical protein
MDVLTMKTTEDFKQFIKDTKKDLFPELSRVFNVSFDYKVESLNKLEEFIKSVYPEGKNISEVSILIILGIYLGEVLRLNIENAEWKTEWTKHNDINLNRSAIEIVLDEENTIEAYPFERILNFISDNTNGIAAYYHVLKLQSEGKLKEKLKNTKAGEWIELPNGDKFRKKEVKIQ